MFFISNVINRKLNIDYTFKITHLDGFNSVLIKIKFNKVKIIEFFYVLKLIIYNDKITLKMS